ncbi:MAG: hypothetical protein RMI63_05415 [Caldimicrobium sp.]|nr:hypothetical protein [Caldimicrobium sp.]MDW8094446.1 hypothetical protein [Caldimicrobium sp.]
MLRLLFKNLESYKIYSLSTEKVLHKLNEGTYVFKLIKKCPSHLILLATSAGDQEPNYFIKLYQPRLFKRNRVKDFKHNLHVLRRLGIPHFQPLLIIYQVPLRAIISGENFYAGIVYYHLSKGFLNKDDFLGNINQGYKLIQNLVQFLYSLHQNKVLLRDTKYNNFYYQPLEGIKIFDIDGIKFLNREPSLGERLRDLAPLAMSLEWIGFREAKKIIFTEYQKVYSYLPEETFVFFSNIVSERKRKREYKNLLSEK